MIKRRHAPKPCPWRGGLRPLEHGARLDVGLPRRTFDIEVLQERKLAGVVHAYSGEVDHSIRSKPIGLKGAALVDVFLSRVIGLVNEMIQVDALGPRPAQLWGRPGGEGGRPPQTRVSGAPGYSRSPSMPPRALRARRSFSCSLAISPSRSGLASRPITPTRNSPRCRDSWANEHPWATSDTMCGA